jgi:hypothetical protein
MIGPQTPPRLATTRFDDVDQWSIYGVGLSNGTVVDRPAPSVVPRAGSDPIDYSFSLSKFPPSPMPCRNEIPYKQPQPQQQNIAANNA